MDKFDFAILRELTQAGKILPGRPGTVPSLREISRRLGIPLGTVRNRINSMYKLGIMKGSSVFPNPSLLGLKSGAYAMDVSPELKKADVIRKIRLIEGVGFIHDFIGTKAWAVFSYAERREAFSATKDRAKTD